MILCEWDALEGDPGQPAYTCMLSYSIVVTHLSFNFLCLLDGLQKWSMVLPSDSRFVNQGYSLFDLKSNK
jgi:hypothetical protein